MSGTSMDGVDLSIISSDGYNEFFTSFDDYYMYDKKLQDQLVRLRDLVLTLSNVSILLIVKCFPISRKKVI